MKKIDILKFRGKNSTTYTGRPQGKMAREELRLDELDLSKETFEVDIPAGTTSFNPSFFLGLFYGSVKKLTLEVFESKYRINIVDTDPDVRAVIMENLEDGKRNALNEMNKSTGFLHLLKK